MNNSHESTWEIYAASWKAATSEDRKAAFAKALSPECEYSDPLAQAKGFDALDGYITGLQQQVPGVHFVTHYFQTHNERSIAKWQMRMGDDTPLAEGVSYGEFDADGKIVSMSSFFELPTS